LHDLYSDNLKNLIAVSKNIENVKTGK